MPRTVSIELSAGAAVALDEVIRNLEGRFERDPRRAQQVEMFRNDPDVQELKRASAQAFDAFSRDERRAAVEASNQAMLEALSNA